MVTNKPPGRTKRFNHHVEPTSLKYSYIFQIDMPLPRFQNLPAERQHSILRAAAEEFAANGYEGASYNQIIERTGLSKGAMYYYFDGKEDLYQTVLTDALGELGQAFGGIEEVTSAPEFWVAYEQLFERAVALFREDPVLAGLAKGMARAMATGHSIAAIEEMVAESAGQMQGLVELGQSLGAIRTDLPTELLVNVLFAMGEATDLWLLQRWGEMPEEEFSRITLKMMALMRQVAEPESANPESKEQRDEVKS